MGLGELSKVATLLRALGDGSVGGQLRCLRLNGHDCFVESRFLSFLKAGRFPRLTELELIDFDFGYWEDKGEIRKKFTISLVEALEARRDFGLPPLTRLHGIADLSVAFLRRVWACCSLDKVAHLEAQGATRLEALAQYLQGHTTGFVALCSVELDMNDTFYNDDDDEETQEDGPSALLQLVAIIGALAQGPAPKLEKLSIALTEPGNELVSTLGHAIGQRKFPALLSMNVDAADLDSVGFRSFIDWLQAFGGLQRLALACEELADPDVVYLAHALQVGLPGLQEIRLSEYGSECFGLVLTSLANGASCAATLTALELGGMLSEAAVTAFVASLTSDAFPCLTRLTLGDMDDSEAASVGLMTGIPQALLALARDGTPSPLTKLSLSGSAGWSTCIRKLTQVFKTDGLPYLETLEVFVDSECKKRGTADLFDLWTKLEDKIKIKRLGLDVPMCKALADRFVELLASPDFCPRLLDIDVIPDRIKKNEIEQAMGVRRLLMEEDRRKREIRAAAGQTAAATAPAAMDEEADDM